MTGLPTPQPHCLYCGGPAEEIGRVNHTIDVVEITYRCTDPRCQGITAGTLTLRRAGLPASGAYLPGDTIPRRPDVQFFQEQP